MRLEKKKKTQEFISTSLPSHKRGLKIHYLYAINPKGKINFKCCSVKITLGTWQMQTQNCSNPSGLPNQQNMIKAKFPKNIKNKPPGKDEERKKAKI